MQSISTGHPRTLSSSSNYNNNNNLLRRHQTNILDT
ncbi:hypothetical protein V6Z11_D01G033900 [Gossypium hirsutum]